MSKDAIDVCQGSGNLFADLGMENADVRQLKSLLAAEIVRLIDADGLSVRAAAARTGFAAADFSRLRTVKLERFTVDRLMTILNRLGQEVTVSLSLRPRSFSL